MALTPGRHDGAENRDRDRRADSQHPTHERLDSSIVDGSRENRGRRNSVFSGFARAAASLADGAFRAEFD